MRDFDENVRRTVREFLLVGLKSNDEVHMNYYLTSATSTTINRIVLNQWRAVSVPDPPYDIRAIVDTFAAK